MKPADLAEARFKNGYSCSQSVFSVLAERWSVPPDTALRIAAGFGGGIARTAGTCGCVTGAVMAIGLAQQDISPEQNRSENEKTYQLCQQFMQEFEDRRGSLLCKELLGCDMSTPEGFAQVRDQGLSKSRCPALIRDAVEIVQEILARR